MQTEEMLLKLIFSNQMLFCGIFGALGGVVHSLDLRSKISLSTIIQKVIISACAGLLLFFVTYDLGAFTPATRIAAAIVAGFYGSAVFRYLARLYIKQLPQVDPEVLKEPTSPIDVKSDIKSIKKTTNTYDKAGKGIDEEEDNGAV